MVGQRALVEQRENTEASVTVWVTRGQKDMLKKQAMAVSSQVVRTCLAQTFCIVTPPAGQGQAGCGLSTQALSLLKLLTTQFIPREAAPVSLLPPYCVKRALLSRIHQCQGGVDSPQSGPSAPREQSLCLEPSTACDLCHGLCLGYVRSSLCLLNKQVPLMRMSQDEDGTWDP